MDLALLGSLFAALLGFFVFCRYGLSRKDKKDCSRGNGKNAASATTTTTAFDGGDVSRDGGYDVIIVGAGVAGAALAHTLGKRLTEPDRIVGELLQPGGYLKLIELGLEDCVEEIDAQRVFGYALFKDGKATRLSYPLEKFHSDVSGSFHNGRFIQRMREKAASLPNVQLEQGTVTSLFDNGTIRGSITNPVLPISSTEVRCLVDVPGQKVPSVSNGEMANYLKTVVAPQRKYKDNAEQKHAGCSSSHSRALLMGDAFNMRHPLTGGGMTVALSDIVVLRNLLRPLHDLNDASALCKNILNPSILAEGQSNFLWQPQSTHWQVPYKVFSSSPDQARKEMRQACFDYLSLGGVFSNGPVSLLSGLNPRPLSLVCHFFAVAIYGVGRLLLPFPSPKRMWIGARLISAASGIIFPIIKAEGVRQMFFPATVPAYYRAPSAH
ncbi:Squalene epoxidase 1 [Sesamum angolense]|uniref:Squalene monooxygenase n=1 Tax=Sesamum angolense TaxID=2727404 RepID=A0AAE1W6F4_9LAMI|nr:Squalene epoxidase 1 [Sesamum angolense]